MIAPMATEQPPRHPHTTTPLLPDGERCDLPDPVAASAPAAGVGPPWTPADVLVLLQETARVLDPRHARLYATMRPERWVAAADLGCRLLLEHERYLQQRRPDGRGGRRTHAGAVYRLLAESNPVQLVAAASGLALIFRQFPPAPPKPARAAPPPDRP